MGGLQWSKINILRWPELVCLAYNNRMTELKRGYNLFFTINMYNCSDELEMQRSNAASVEFKNVNYTMNTFSATANK